MSAEPGELSYPFAEKPLPGKIVFVAPGVAWLRMPLPIALNHINLWLLEDEQGWTIVDTGVSNDETRNLWEQIFSCHLNGKPVNRLIVTHMHADHVGLAGWLAERWKVELCMSGLEYFTCRVLVADTGKEALEEGLRFYYEAGFDEESLDVYRSRFGMFGSFIGKLPQKYRRLADGDSLRMAGQDWKVIVGRGHSPEHVCLFCPALNLFIAGDQILPRISPNVSVRPTEPAANPLQEWLDSCEALPRALPKNVLVLPSHGYPFHGAHQRWQQLIVDHESALTRLYDLCREPQRAVDTFPALFNSAVDSHSLIIATGEGLAHLNYLLEKGRLRMTRDKDGVKHYEGVKSDRH
ncbi:MAG: MBL fold metallo-hydrolase [Gammaproteobacteria bacterium]|nr:MBL fold metallo-hydrolase [Gammaproteobacteria bacterium]MDP7419889.1 MBL fold metallo-hydrolase [Gammaproteobacteria bacterium]